ncbi:MAG TPA: hypothetical protein PLV25_08235, partial [Opitutales bacterium]|nr:hypothetical protein [Opitutales bacterium]
GFILHLLNPALRGYEMLVASSNNKAVENVSAELPVSTAVDSGIEGLDYFKAVSDAVINAGTKGPRASKIETWGLISAVLGRQSNRASFRAVFSDAFLQGRLAQELVAIELVGDRNSVLTEWLHARDRFLKALKDSRDEIASRRPIELRLLKLEALYQRRQQLRSEANQARKQRNLLYEKHRYLEAC